MEGMMGITGTALTPTSPNTTCSSNMYTATDRWSWGHCTVASRCGDPGQEPQDQASCTAQTPTMHQYGWSQTYVLNADVNGTHKSASAAYADAGTGTVLHDWQGGTVPAVGDIVTIQGAQSPWG